MKGTISEIIAYKNKAVTATEKNKIESYLGIKYGLTLSVASINYANSAGTNLYSISSTYTNNIIGIGRDDIEAFLQKQSHTRDDITRIYINTLSLSNKANTGAFANNLSYVVMGADNGLMCVAGSSSLEIPAGCGINSRISREWKVTNTNFTQTFNMDVKLNGCAGTASVNPSNLRLLVDDDGTFNSGSTQCYYNGDGTGITFSYTSPIITITGISNTHIPNNSTRYITIGSNSITTPLPIELVNFESDCGLTDNSTILKWTTLTETNNDYFEIQKSSDALSWTSIAIIDGAGNSTSMKNYIYKDNDRNIQSEAGMSYYRLKQVDFDGTQTTYNSVIYTDQSCQVFFPNPASDKIYIKDFTHFKSYEIVNQLGQVIKVGEVTSNIIMLNNIADGMYHIRLVGIDEKTISKKLQINKK